MSNKNKNNMNNNKKPKLDSSSKHINNNLDMYCNNCGILLDNDKNIPFIFSDEFGEMDVCEDCFEILTRENLNMSSTTLPQLINKQPILHSKPSFNSLFSQNNTSSPSPQVSIASNTPQLRLVFLNTNSNPTQKDKSKKEEKPKKNSKNGKNIFPPRCNSTNCDNNLEDNSNFLFFQQILNRLHNIVPSNENSDNRVNNDETETEEDDDTPLEFEWLGDNIKTIDDLITLGKSYDSHKRKRYNLNLKQLNKLVEPLEELKAMVGMTNVKKIIFDQLIYYLQNLDDKNVDMLHTVIVGPPGVGKTQLTHIIAKIYNRLGFLKTDKVICVKRDDLIGEYIGQTAPKTRKVLERALGGVLLLDEIYSLAPTSERDFAKEAIDMINMYLSEHAHDLVCVVAGYKKPTYEKFFAQNEGLARRFTHHFEIKGYTHDELALIFKKYLEGQKWFLDTSLDEIGEIIKGHIELFPNFGGDMATLFACCKKAHSRRLLTISTEAELDATKKKIQKSDILEAVSIYKEIKEKHSSTEEEDKAKYIHMYV